MVANETPRRAASPSTSEATATAVASAGSTSRSASAAGIEHLRRERGDVTAPHRDHDVSLARLGGHEGDEFGSVGHPDHPGSGGALGDRIEHELAGHSRDRGRSGTVDLGDDDDVGTGE